MPANPQLLTVRQVSEVLSVPPRTIQRWVQDGRLPGIRIAKTTRIPASAVEALLAPIMTTYTPYSGTTLSPTTIN
jgi:excisionase family DNA binding protein